MMRSWFGLELRVLVVQWEVLVFLDLAVGQSFRSVNWLQSFSFFSFVPKITSFDMPIPSTCDSILSKSASFTFVVESQSHHVSGPRTSSLLIINLITMFPFLPNTWAWHHGPLQCWFCRSIDEVVFLLDAGNLIDGNVLRCLKLLRLFNWLFHWEVVQWDWFFLANSFFPITHLSFFFLAFISCA